MISQAKAENEISLLAGQGIMITPDAPLQPNRQAKEECNIRL